MPIVECSHRHVKRRTITGVSQICTDELCIMQPVDFPIDLAILGISVPQWVRDGMTLSDRNLTSMDNAPRLSDQATHALTGMEPELSGARRRRFLILEDDLWGEGFLLPIFARRGYRVHHIVSGDEALDLLLREPPTLFITDLYHPGISGIPLCREIRRHPALDDLPILIWTAAPPLQSEQLAHELRLQVIDKTQFFGFVAAVIGVVEHGADPASPTFFDALPTEPSLLHW